MLPKLKLRPWQLSLLASFFIIAVNNPLLFQGLFNILDMTSLTDLGFLLTLVVLMIVVLNTIFLLLGIGGMLKVIVAITVIFSASIGYFVNEMGVVFDQEMFANVADTIRERNLLEARELGSLPFVWHMLLLGIIPAALLAFVQLRPGRPLVELRDRAVVVIVSILVFGALGMGNYRSITYLARENRDLRFKITPIFAFVSLGKQARDSWTSDPPFKNLAADAHQEKSGKKPKIGIMVVGETARADHFSLNGYSKATNPTLEEEQGLMFADATSCGTSTAYSVPCMFFLRGRDDYTPDVARAESNVLDLLATAGVKTLWIDNNSTCKHVCDRIESVNMRIKPDQSMSLDGDFDIELVRIAERYIEDADKDLLIVLHMMGSHGPAYSNRYPPEFAPFAPSCESLSPTECSTDEVANAYDNTIAYTDFVLHELIGLLKEREDKFDSFLFYASDHGESLGENGVYLHGLPYALAPASQTDIPMIIWLSPELSESKSVDIGTYLVSSEERLSHDNIPHTLLGLYDVQSKWYEADDDIFPIQLTTRPSSRAANTTAIKRYK
jgi:lipid A ethanolaminephosphotransferase